MLVIGLVLFVVHVLAFIAGGANAVLMPIMGPRIAAAAPDTREVLTGIVVTLAKVGKWAMVTLLLTGPLIMWLKWDWAIPNVWFWVKMAGIVAMLVFIGLNEMNFKKAVAGDVVAAANSRRFGQLTAVAFLVVIIAAVFAFN